MPQRVPQLESDAVLSAIENSDAPLLIDFGAPWCLPCRRQRPVTQQVARRMGHLARVCAVDIDGNRSLAARLNIHSIPTLIVFSGSVERERLIGIQSAETLIKALSRWMKQPPSTDGHREA